MIDGCWPREIHLLAEEQLHLPRLLRLVGGLARPHLTPVLCSAPVVRSCIPVVSSKYRGFWFKYKLVSLWRGCTSHIVASLHLFVLWTPAAFPPFSLFESFSFETFYSCFLCICLFRQVIWHNPKTLEVMIWVQVALMLPVPWFLYLLKDGTVLSYSGTRPIILRFCRGWLPPPFLGLAFCLFFACEEFLSFFPATYFEKISNWYKL